MPLSYSPRRLTLNRNKLRILLCDLRDALDYSDPEWADYLGLSSSQYRKFRDGSWDLPVNALYSLSKNAKLDLKALLEGEINLSQLARENALKKASDFRLPDKYATSAFSKRLSSINILDCVEEFFGWRLRFQALKRLGISEAAFLDPNKRINIQFLADLCRVLKESGMNEKSITALGAHSVITYMDTPIGKQLARYKTLPSVYEKLFEDLIGKYLERNFFYRLLSLSDTECVIEGRPNAELQEAFHTEKVGNQYFCMTKVGVASSVPGYLGLPFSKVKETKCIHRGDPACWFHVDYSSSIWKQDTRH